MAADGLARSELRYSRVRYKNRNSVLTIGSAQLDDFDGEVVFSGSFGCRIIGNQLCGGIPWENDESVQCVEVVEKVTVHGACFLFSGLPGLKSIQGLGNLHIVGDADFMFSGCPIEYLDLRELDVSRITSISSIFNGATAKEIDVTGWDTSNVFDFAGAFLLCEQLETIKGIGDWDVSEAYSMASMFRHCCALQSLDLQKWDMSNVVDVSNMFMHAVSLSSLKADFNLESAERASSMFAGCSSLRSLNLVSKGWALPLRCKTNSMFLGSGVSPEYYPKNYQLEVGDSFRP